MHEHVVGFKFTVGCRVEPAVNVLSSVYLSWVRLLYILFAYSDRFIYAVMTSILHVGQMHGKYLDISLYLCRKWLTYLLMWLFILS